jgi:hypothetical protein
MKINSFVVTKSSSELKKIVDKEVICGQKIFYMEDNTSYHESQLSSSPEDVKLSLFNKVKNNEEKYKEIYKDIVKEMVSNSLSFIRKSQITIPD